jgi:hypothetical protein
LAGNVDVPTSTYDKPLIVVAPAKEAQGKALLPNNPTLVILFSHCPSPTHRRVTNTHTHTLHAHTHTPHPISYFPVHTSSAPGSSSASTSCPSHHFSLVFGCHIQLSSPCLTVSIIQHW